MPVSDYVGPVLTSGVLGSVATYAVKSIFERRRLGAETDAAEADTAAVLSKTALELLQPLKEQVKDLTEQLDRVKAKAEDLEQRLDDCKAASRAKDEQIWMLRRARASNEREHPGHDHT